MQKGSLMNSGIKLMNKRNILTKEILTLKKNQRIKKYSKKLPNPFRKDNTIISSILEGKDSKVYF